MKKVLNIKNQTFWLLPSKCLFWEEQNALIISDVHLGKASHFQKSGIPIPAIKGKEDLNKIAKIIFDVNPEKVIFLGDLFHSSNNEEWSWFTSWIEHFPSIKFLLVEGNHDTYIVKSLPPNLSATAEFEQAEILLTHEPLNHIPENYFNIAGHLHPGIVITGKGRQSLKLPCFWVSKKQMIVPAFGNLTGYVKMPAKNAEVYAIAENEIIKI